MLLQKQINGPVLTTRMLEGGTINTEMGPDYSTSTKETLVRRLKNRDFNDKKLEKKNEERILQMKKEHVIALQEHQKKLRMQYQN